MKLVLKYLVTITCVLSIALGNAQELGEFNPKDDTSGLGKLNSKTKRIYISSFAINFQLLNEKEKTKKGGALFRDKGVRGDATAELIVGLGNLSENDFQSVTDRLYQNFIKDLKDKGFELINAETAGKTKTYADYTKASGPFVMASDMPGIITAIPAGFNYYYKEKSKVGKVLGSKFKMDTTPQNLSKDLEDAVVVSVDLYVFFMKDVYAFQGNAANIKIKTQLSLVANEAISAKSDDKGFFKKDVEYVTGSNTISFVCGKYSIGGSAETTYTGLLKKDLVINNVIEEKKMQSFAKGAVDFVGNDTYFGKLYSAENKTSNNTQLIEVDASKYKEGVFNAGKQFLSFHVNAFNSEFK